MGLCEQISQAFVQVEWILKDEILMCLDCKQPNEVGRLLKNATKIDTLCRLSVIPCSFYLMKSIKKYNKNKQRLRQSQQIEDNEPDDQRSPHHHHHHHLATSSSDQSWRPNDEVAVKKTTEINVCLDLTLISYLLVQQSKSLTTISSSMPLSAQPSLTIDQDLCFLFSSS